MKNWQQEIFKDKLAPLSLFNEGELAKLSQQIFTKSTRGKIAYYTTCISRKKEIQLRPEEVIRQLYAMRLIDSYGYPGNRIAMEYEVTFGSEKRQVDIVIFDKDKPDTIYIVVELKSPHLKKGKDQLKSYCHATGAPIGVWTNGEQISHYHRKDPNYFEDITDIPNSDQSLANILQERFTLRDLIIKDKIPNQRKSLKQVIVEMEDEVLSNAGVDAFEEVFKLVFTKLYDELQSQQEKVLIENHLNQNLDAQERGNYERVKKCLTSFNNSGQRLMEFRNTGQTENELFRKIEDLFVKAQQKWPGIFPPNTKLGLRRSHLAICISSLQDVKLFNSNLSVVDEAFEYLVNKSSKGEKGQYFTPRHVIDMCVLMLNPQPGEYMIDPAAGSCGFPMHTIFHITSHLFTNAEIGEEEKSDTLKVFGIDFDEKAVRIARTLNLIAGDGEANVLHLNTLDYTNWDEETTNTAWSGIYIQSFNRLKNLAVEGNRRFKFDVLMANPPFAGDIKESRLLHRYALSRNRRGNKQRPQVGRDILFIERNLDFVKPGGRMAIVLPQGRFNNTSDAYIRNFIAERARILAVVGLHGNTFKPHTGTKTSVLFLQKWNNDPNAGQLCPNIEDYPIFFAVSEQGGKDTSGDYIFAQNPDGTRKLDKNGHIVVQHDLHSHDGVLPDGIAEFFIKFAKKEGLSFWNKR